MKQSFLLMGHVSSDNLSLESLFQRAKNFDQRYPLGEVVSLDEEDYVPLKEMMKSGNILDPEVTKDDQTLEEILKQSTYADNLFVMEDCQEKVVKRFMKIVALLAKHGMKTHEVLSNDNDLLQQVTNACQHYGMNIVLHPVHQLSSERKSSVDEENQMEQKDASILTSLSSNTKVPENNLKLQNSNHVKSKSSPEFSTTYSHRIPILSPPHLVPNEFMSFLNPYAKILGLQLSFERSGGIYLTYEHFCRDLPINVEILSLRCIAYYLGSMWEGLPQMTFLKSHFKASLHSIHKFRKKYKLAQTREVEKERLDSQKEGKSLTKGAKAAFLEFSWDTPLEKMLGWLSLTERFPESTKGELRETLERAQAHFGMGQEILLKVRDLKIPHQLNQRCSCSLKNRPMYGVMLTDASTSGGSQLDPPFLDWLAYVAHYCEGGGAKGCLLHSANKISGVHCIALLELEAMERGVTKSWPLFQALKVPPENIFAFLDSKIIYYMAKQKRSYQTPPV